MVSRQIQMPPSDAERVGLLAKLRGCSEAEVYRQLVSNGLPALEAQYRPGYVAPDAEVTQDLKVPA